MLEALLTTAVVSGLFFIAIGLIQNYTEQVLAKSTANYMDNISSAIVSILQNPNNFSQIYTDVDNQPNDIREVTIADIIVGDIGGVNLQDSGLLNANISTSTPLKTGVRIMLRSSGTDALEVIIATDRRVGDARIRAAAEYSKLNGGFYRDITRGVRSAYNAWSFDPTILVGTDWWDNIADADPPSISDGSYLINYRHIAFDAIAGDYLYRIRVDTKPELNTIYTDLNMGGQNILGADNIDPSGNINIESNAIVNGAMNVTNSAIINDGNIRSFNKLRTNNATINNTAGGITGNFIVQGELGVNNLNTTNSLSADNATFRSGLTTTANISSTNINNVQSVNVIGGVNTNILEGSSAANRVSIALIFLLMLER